MNEDIAMSVAGLVMVAAMILGAVLGVIDNYLHRRRIRDASRNKGV
ncbi:hypothetical protein [Xanthomonas sp. 3058]|nr:hypothetical protein [Xanthomonas sp. 3058]MBB5865920.1 hypothetical protein [Xanthomonas sp. 3058]